MNNLVLVLLVEDEHLIRDLLEISLEDGGFSVITASDGEEAMKTLADNSDIIRALITDIRLGQGLDGWDVARRARHAKPDLPVIYMTGDSAANWAAEGVPKSILVQKPFATAQIVTAVTTLLNENSSNTFVG